MLRNLCLAVALCAALACVLEEEPRGTGSTPPDTARRPAAVAPEASPDEVALQELSDRLVRGVRSANADTIASVYSQHAEVFAPGESEILLGQEAIREHYAKRLEARIVEEFELKRSDFTIRPEVAYSFAVWRAVMRPASGGLSTSSTGHLTDIYRRDGAGPWVVAHEHVSLAPSDSLPADSLRAVLSPF